MTVKLNGYKKMLEHADGEHKKELASRVGALQAKIRDIEMVMEKQDKAPMRPKYKGTGYRFFDLGT
jgi:hypothetical protein